MPITLNLDFFSCLVGSSDKLSSFSGDGSLDSGRDGGRDGGREGGLEGVLEGGRDPLEGPLTEEFLELCLDGGGFMLVELMRDLLLTLFIMNCLPAPSSTDGGQGEAGEICLVFKMLLELPVRVLSGV